MRGLKDYLLEHKVAVVICIAVVLACMSRLAPQGQVKADDAKEIYYTEDKSLECQNTKPIPIPTISPIVTSSKKPEKANPIKASTPEIRYLDEIPLDKHLQQYIFDMAKKYSVSPYLIFAIIERESKFDTSAIGDGGESYGLMQIKKKYQKERMKRLGVRNLAEPKSNVLVGIDYLAELFWQYEDVVDVLHAYNGGGAYAEKLSRKGATSKYATAILSRANELEGN